jgi:outer membrane protein assembly factor BamD
MRRTPVGVSLLMLVSMAACHHGGPSASATPLSFTPAQIDSQWNAAVALYRKGDWNKAGTALDRLQLEMPSSDRRVATGRLYLGEVRLHQHSNLQAVREFRRVSDEYPSDTLAPLALLRAGDSYRDLWRRPELDPTYGFSAMQTYQELLTRYPDASVADSARQRIQDLNNDFAYKQYKSALYYVRYKAFESAVLYLKDLVSTWPRAEIVPEALGKLIETYQKLGWLEDITETCTYFRQQWPKAPNLATSCPATAKAAADSGSAKGS